MGRWADGQMKGQPTSAAAYPSPKVFWFAAIIGRLTDGWTDRQHTSSWGNFIHRKCSGSQRTGRQADGWTDRHASRQPTSSCAQASPKVFWLLLTSAPPKDRSTRMATNRKMPARPTNPMWPLINTDHRSHLGRSCAAAHGFATGFWPRACSGTKYCSAPRPQAVIQTNRIQFVLVNMQNRKFGPYLPAIHRMFILVMVRGHSIPVAIIAAGAAGCFQCCHWNSGHSMLYKWPRDLFLDLQPSPGMPDSCHSMTASNTTNSSR
jgi:hypothetical protein